MIQALYTYHVIEDNQPFWVFDFPALGVSKEPFVSGIPEMIEFVLGTKGVARAKQNGFVLLFEGKDENQFDTALDGGLTIERVRHENNGTVYKLKHIIPMEGWLCPVLNKFFPESPKFIRFKIVPI